MRRQQVHHLITKAHVIRATKVVVQRIMLLLSEVQQTAAAAGMVGSASTPGRVTYYQLERYGVTQRQCPLSRTWRTQKDRGNVTR